MLIHGKENNDFWEELSGLAETPLLMLESFADSSNTLEAMAYASAGAERYDSYLAKFDSEVAGGTCNVSSANLNVNKTKLSSFTKRTLSSDEPIEPIE